MPLKSLPVLFQQLSKGVHFDNYFSKCHTKVELVKYVEKST